MGLPPIIGITMGDPAGVGPEIIVKALSHDDLRLRPLVIADSERIREASQICACPLKVRSIASISGACWQRGIVDVVDATRVPRGLAYGRVSAAGGQAAFECIRYAVDLAMSSQISAICTAPLNKEALHLAGHRYPGHTEILAELTGASEVSMLLTSERLKVIHVTTHVGLVDAIEYITAGLVFRTIERGHRLLTESGLTHPSIAVCGINPHAGENGLFGRGEEATKVSPAVKQAREAGIDAHGPIPADTAFFRAVRGDFDLVVAMYHDQGHAPMKVLGFETGVNVTVGLPVVRTSVDHGTAFDIAGSGTASELSMLEALRQAAALSAAL
jgi:4-phospho-D-threonate 3-dehydrogenase / 4-phospho-D-erythronate 3-dehydrogenase